MMKHIITLIFAISFTFNTIAGNDVNFNSYFIDKSLRLDVLFAGNNKSMDVFLQQIKQEIYWSGSQTNLIDKFNYGSYKYMVYDVKDNKLIFSKGFGSLFQEWQSTEEAKTTKRGFYETIIFPFPKNTVRVEIYSRDKKMNLTKIFEITINPKDYFINKEKREYYNSYSVVNNGNPNNKVDIAFIPDGYTKDEMDKFKRDAKRFAGYLFNSSPFKENKYKFNIWAIEAISQESGTDIPGDSIYKNTIVNTNFYTFNSDRYLMTYDIKKVRDIAANVPYDQIYIIVNTEKYGGGAVYNYYSVTASDNQHSEYVFCHEFGHAFAGLGDEYYDSEVAVQDYYDLSVEPWEPNLTTLVNFKSKWQEMVTKDTPIPTTYNEKYNNVGAFEGGGYINKGMYRPSIDCQMKSIKVDAFCPVCKKAIIDMINYYTE